MMTNNIWLKIVHVIFALAIIVYMYRVSNQPSSEKSIEWQKNVAKKESWLISELNYIDDFMALPDSNITHLNRRYAFIGSYVSANANFEKLSNLKKSFVEKGWVDATYLIDEKMHKTHLRHISDKVIKHTRMLCKDDATMLIYMTDMRNHYTIDLFEVKTAIKLDLMPSLPCYGFKP